MLYTKNYRYETTFSNLYSDNCYGMIFRKKYTINFHTILLPKVFGRLSMVTLSECKFQIEIIQIDYYYEQEK